MLSTEVMWKYRGNISFGYFLLAPTIQCSSTWHDGCIAFSTKLSGGKVRLCGDFATRGWNRWNVPRWCCESFAVNRFFGGESWQSRVPLFWKWSTVLYRFQSKIWRMKMIPGLWRHCYTSTATSCWKNVPGYKVITHALEEESADWRSIFRVIRKGLP